jgi:hypothetical protein
MALFADYHDFVARISSLSNSGRSSGSWFSKVFLLPEICRTAG